MSLSKRKRDLQRLLEREGLPAEMRAAKEAELAAMTDEAARRDAKAKEQANFYRYKHVRFFERKKLERRIAQLTRDQPAGATESAELRRLRGDLLYVRHFPLTERYISILLPMSDAPAEVLQKRADIRQRLLDDQAAGRLGGAASSSTSSTSTTASSLPADDAGDDGNDGDDGKDAAEPAAPVVGKRRRPHHPPRGRGGRPRLAPPADVGADADADADAGEAPEAGGDGHSAEAVADPKNRKQRRRMQRLEKQRTDEDDFLVAPDAADDDAAAAPPARHHRHKRRE